MTETLDCALLLLDFQMGAGDQPYAAQAAQQAQAALKAARQANLPVFFSKIEFLTQYADIATSNKVFREIKEKKLLPPGKSTVIPSLQPQEGEVVVAKDRFSAFMGNALAQTLRAKGINHLVLAGVTTSGVVLATYAAAADMDYGLTILSDACADTDSSLQEQLMKSLFPRSAAVTTVAEWANTLGGANLPE